MPFDPTSIRLVHPLESELSSIRSAIDVPGLGVPFSPRVMVSF